MRTSTIDGRDETIAADSETGIDSDCFCGSCGPCRRELRRIDALLAAPVLTLESSAAAKAAKEARELREFKASAARQAAATDIDIVQKRETDVEKVIAQSSRVTSTATVSVDPDKAAKNDKRRQRREMLRSQRITVDGYLFHPRPDLKHGTPSAYADYGCRCPLCQEYCYKTYSKYRQKKKSN